MEKNNLIQVLQDWELLLSEISRNGTALDNNALYVLNETIRAALAPVDVDAIHQDGFDEGFESGKLEATEFDRDLRRAVFGFLEKRGQIENGEEYTAQDIMDCLVAYEHYLINTNKAPKPVDVEGLANYIRAINGDNTMGAGELAEKITDHLSARGCFGVAEGYALVPLSDLPPSIFIPLPEGRVLGETQKIESIVSIEDAYKIAQCLIKAMLKAAPKKEGRNE